jgi:hypothetical protein
LVGNKHFSDDRMREQRFERKAKRISSLSHPRIRVCVMLVVKMGPKTQ